MKEVIPQCPSCKGRMLRVRNNSEFINNDQFDAIKKGDWYCEGQSVFAPTAPKHETVYTWDVPTPAVTVRTLFIPPLGTKLTLAEDWQFTVYSEFRNTSLIQLMHNLPIDRTFTGYFSLQRQLGNYNYGQPIGQFTWAAGTVLTMDRIYIRKGSADFDSVTFYAKYAVTPKKSRSVRFWAKLSDVNRMRIVVGV